MRVGDRLVMKRGFAAQIIPAPQPQPRGRTRATAAVGTGRSGANGEQRDARGTPIRLALKGARHHLCPPSSVRHSQARAIDTARRAGIVSGVTALHYVENKHKAGF